MVCKWQVEIDPYATKVLEKHWPDVARFRDVRDCGRHNLETVDLICGGFPCQGVSNAGHKRGIDGDERSGLWSEFHRIVGVLRPRYVIVENVTAIVSRGLRRVLGDLAACGYDAEWGCLPAAAFGAPHERKRIFIVAYPNGEHGSEGLVFFEGYARTLLETCDRQRARLWAEAPAYPTGMANGIPHRVDRLRCLGNAVVPQIAQWLGGRIIAGGRMDWAED